ncbi:MAG: cation-translocating P-type ATPase [Actinobacteria bacterium]|nr:cation-translocating P-type ATPase [Actinomycetota bacterium]
MPNQVDLVVTGMTCASCAMRIEKKLNKLEDVKASVNYATGIAHVEFGKEIEIESLISTVDAAGYNAIAPNPLLDEQVAKWEKEHEADLFRRWLVGALIALPIFVVAMFASLQFSNWQLIAVILALPVATWTAWPLHRAMLTNAQHKSTTMDTLVSIGVIAAYLGSIYQLISANGHHQPHLYIDVAAVVPVFVVFGRWLESRNKRQASSALRAIANATPKTANVFRDNKWLEIDLADIQEAELVLVGPETTIAVDGLVISGNSTVDISMLTGESKPLSVSTGSEVFAGTLNLDGQIELTVTSAGARTKISQIASLVATAQNSKAEIARLADRISAIFVPAVLALTVTTGILWFFYDSSRVIEVMIAVLVIACPCALGLATPTALVIGSGRAARLGILIAGPEVFEQSTDVDTIIFDKTGTLTTGKMTVFDNSVSLENLGILKALAETNQHPASIAIANSIEAATAEISNIQMLPGLGVRATHNSKTVELGSGRIHSLSFSTPDTQSYLFLDGMEQGSVTLADTLNLGVEKVLAQLHKAKISVIVATGDTSTNAEKLVSKLPIDSYIAGCTPEQKLELVKNLQSQGHKVAMVGDGTNDAPALAQADMSIAIGTGTDVAKAAADITLLRPELTLVPTAISLSRKTLGVIKQNLFWAFGYNVAAIPLAMTGRLSPMIAGIAMSASSVLVVSNSLRLRKIKI